MSIRTRWQGQEPVQRARTLYPGVTVSALLALAAYALSERYGAPVMLFALLLGLAVNFLGQDERCSPGIDFCSKTLLRAGVALLGLRVTAGHLMDLGWSSALLIVTGVLLTTALGAALGRGLRLGAQLGVLTGGSVAICGASAAIAIYSVLPARDQAEKQLVFTIIGVTALSTIAMIVYPTIAGLIGMTDVEAGVFLGGTIHDVAQVVGAGYSVSERAGDLATIIKLLRVAMLVPMVIVIMLVFRHRTSSSSATFPGFLLVFIGLATINSLGLAPELLVDAGNSLSRACLVTAIAAVGMQTALRELAHAGWSPVVLMLLETAFIAAFVLAGYMVLS